MNKVPGNWESYPVLPNDLSCEECEEPFSVGDKVWTVKNDDSITLCTTCLERSLYRISYMHPELIQLAGLSLMLYRPNRELTLDEISTLEVAIHILSVEGHHMDFSLSVH